MAALVPMDLLRLARGLEQSLRLCGRDRSIVPAIHHQQRPARKLMHRAKRIGGSADECGEWRALREITTGREHHRADAFVARKPGTHIHTATSGLILLAGVGFQMLWLTLDRLPRKQHDRRTQFGRRSPAPPSRARC